MKQKRVVGVSYDTSKAAAPVVVMKAAGAEAQAIIDKAQRTDDVVTIANPALVQQLYKIPIDAEIGRDLFPVMATLLAHVLHIDRQKTEGLTNGRS